MRRSAALAEKQQQAGGLGRIAADVEIFARLARIAVEVCLGIATRSNIAIPCRARIDQNPAPREVVVPLRAVLERRVRHRVDAPVAARLGDTAADSTVDKAGAIRTSLSPVRTE